MFSTLTIRGCALSASRAPITVSLKATSSFPACAYDYIEDPHPVPDSWAARGVSTPQGTLKVSLLERISEGRMGVTYSAHVISATDDDGSDITKTLPESVCLKFTKPQYCRSLAREAWFYEQLDECQGISVARCHGFFSSAFSEQTTTPNSLLPWCDLEYPSEPDDEDGANLPWTPVVSADWLPDDRPCDEYWDTRNFKRDSPWNRWNFSTQESPTISVLVLELLGEPCSKHWRSQWARDKPPEGLKCVFSLCTSSRITNSPFREDITTIMDDITIYGVVHNDVTAFNFLRFTDNEVDAPQARCPRHNIVHGWRIIDFDRSLRVDMENGTAEAKEDPALYNSASIGAPGSFWGKCFWCKYLSFEYTTTTT